MMKNIAGAVAGVITAFITVMLVDKIGHMIYPPPEGLDFTDPEAIGPYMATLPIGAYLFILASSVTAAFIGTMVGCYIGTASPNLFGAIVGGIVLAATIANFIFIPHPLWLAIATLLGIVLSTLLAIRLAPTPSTSETDDRDSDSGQA